MTAFTIGVTLLIIFNLAVGFGVFRSAAYSRNQKIAQVAFIFLLPVVGATIVWLFLREALPSLPHARENPDADRDDFKTVGMDAPGTYGSTDQY